MGREESTQALLPQISTQALVPRSGTGNSPTRPTADLDEAVLSPAWIASHPATPVRIDSLVFEGSPRLGGEDPEHVCLLAETSDPLPPIIVHQPTMRVIDGIHRVRAALLKNRDEIEARLLRCDEDAAFVVAVKANITHGLPLSQADRTAAAVRIITHHPHWSDRAVAAATGLSDKTISRIRSRTMLEAPQPTARLGRDGRLRPLDTVARRQQAAAMISERPEVVLREVARATGLSVATVRDVRQRVARGEDPVPDRYRSAGRPDTAAPGPVPEQKRVTRTRYKEATPDRQALLTKLRNDPSLTSNEAGRNFLRWLHRHSVDSDDLKDVCHGLPDYWAPVVAKLARTCATAWIQMAEQLEQRPVE
jgi:ParB-like chromosome segregation protein Spo0J